MKPYFQDDAVTIYHGDCLEVMRGLESVDTIITDPPYGLRFMGKKWDYEIPSVAVFTEILRVAKCGATLLCFGGTRTWHRIAVNIEDAGWEIRDTLMWIYGSGFPKSLDIGKHVDGFEGYGTALKPAFEPIIMAMKPCEGTFAENALKWGVAGLNIDGARVGIDGGETHKGGFGSGIYGDSKGVETDLTTKGRFPANVIHDGSEEVLAGFPQNAGAYAPVKSGQKAFGGVIYGKYQSGGDDGASFYGDGLGSASRFFYCAKASKAERNAGCEGLPLGEPPASARSKPAEGRNNPLGEPRTNHHPTVKPLALMEYLCTLTKTPTGGIVLDPYMGSGTTGMACKKTGRDFIGIEISEEYLEIAKRRIEATEINEPNPQQVMDLGI